ncbi:MAG: bifunctional folylpolyglutamate synthase/dihydrofolate synthase [Lachnospiraceae bacterium]|jgi:dihydrofolate synthase/folylpolyglutamate synthase|nr:bifunctional folylpolyglutamate synthase/dihydrofolate synthase [Lachnospiraceae bacterium]
MTDREAQEYIESWDSYRIVPGLDSVRRLCSELGEPQEKLRVIHIAGTDGKGSVAHFLSCVLHAAGYRTGCYQSPTIDGYRDRFMINGRPIAKRRLNEYLDLLKEAAARLTGAGFPHPTAFEMETGLMFRYFADEGCDAVVCECGMGGALDATNIVQSPAASVITAIGMDHMKFLGGTLREIAGQKAGIIKQGCPCFTAPQQPEAAQVLKERAAAMHAPLVTADVKGRTAHVKTGLGGSSFTWERPDKQGSARHLHVSVPEPGTYQIDNAALALTVLEYLREHGFPFTDRQLLAGMADPSPWPGRFEVVSRKPLLILDGAHNEAAALRLSESLRAVLPGRRFIFMVGVLADKEYDKVLKDTADLADAIVTLTPLGNRRALPALELAKTAASYCSEVTAADSPEEALEMAELLAASKGDAVVGFGSLSWLGEMRRIVARRRG